MLHGVRVQVPPFAPNNMMKIKGLVYMMGLSLFCIYIKKKGDMATKDIGLKDGGIYHTDTKHGLTYKIR